MSADKTPEQFDAERIALIKKWRKRAVIAGIVLALACKSLPPDYQAPCAAIANLCTGGISVPMNP